jgi:hypothetical protein
MNCDKLIHERVTLFRNISDIVPSFTTMSDVEKFMFLLTCHDLDICKVVILGVSSKSVNEAKLINYKIIFFSTGILLFNILEYIIQR